MQIENNSNQQNQTINVDALLPQAMAIKAEDIGVKKASLDMASMFSLAVLAGAFIAIGAIFATTVSAGSLATTDLAAGAPAFTSTMPFGFTRLFMGLVFSVGLILVVVGGAELFTGNNLITMAFMSRRINLLALLRNWIVVYIGNFVGAIATAYVVFLTEQHAFGGASVGLAVLRIGDVKCSFDFVQAVALGVMCNALVCMAVWMTYSARTTTDKILVIILPIACFVAAGFEHSIANMYFIPLALFVKTLDPTVYAKIVADLNNGADFAHLSWNNFFVANLLPVTVGNIIGGVVMVGLIYWFVYLRKKGY
jgi:formate/nitrite transporter